MDGEMQSCRFNGEELKEALTTDGQFLLVGLPASKEGADLNEFYPPNTSGQNSTQVIIRVVSVWVDSTKHWHFP